MSSRHTSVTACAAMALLLAFGSVSACSGEDAKQASDTTDLVVNPTAPSSQGDACSDPRGDLDAGAIDDPAVLAPLAGIDLIDASARPVDDLLEVKIRTDGPIALVPGATFYVAQGQPLDPLSFEMRLTETGGAWTFTLITWSPNEQRRPLDIVPTVDENTLSFSVPLSDLPPIALMLGFGSSVKATDGTIVMDDCSSLWSQS